MSEVVIYLLIWLKSTPDDGGPTEVRKNSGYDAIIFDVRKGKLKATTLPLVVNWQLAQKIVVNWHLAEKLVVNWQLGTPISTLL